MLVRSSENILSDIRYFLKVRDYLVTIPALDYALHMASIKLTTDKLDSLQKEYRTITKDINFQWCDYQFKVGDYKQLV